MSAKIAKTSGLKSSIFEQQILGESLPLNNSSDFFPFQSLATPLN